MFLVALMILIAFGLVVMASASMPLGARKYSDAFFFLKRQARWLACGVVLGWIASRIPHRLWRTWAYPLAALALALLIAVLAFGPKINGARRWLFSMQPSEFARFAELMLLARYMSDIPLRMKRLREGTIIPALLLIVPFCLILAEPDVGGAAELAAVAGVMMLLGGCSSRWLQLLAAGVSIVIIVYVSFDAHRSERVRMWWQSDPNSPLAWQSDQTKRAFALGGWTGTGLGHGHVKRHLPEAHTDYVLAVVAEELGLLGTLSIVALYVALTVGGLAIARNTTDRFGRLLGHGLVLALSFQALLNVAVVAGAMPPKGVPAPLISYGGSSYIVTLLQAGILLGMARTRNDRALTSYPSTRAQDSRFWPDVDFYKRSRRRGAVTLPKAVCSRKRTDNNRRNPEWRSVVSDAGTDRFMETRDEQ